MPTASGAGADGVIYKRPAQRPDRPGDAVTVRNDRFESALDPVAVVVRDGERREQLDGVAAVPGNLRENAVLFEQRDRDQLAEQPLARGLQQAPGRLELERPGRSEFNSDHQSLAADLPQ